MYKNTIKGWIMIIIFIISLFVSQQTATNTLLLFILYTLDEIRVALVKPPHE